MFPLVIILLLCCSVVAAQAQSNSSPYISPTTVLLNYKKMVHNFKILIYKPNNPQFKFPTTVESLFYSSLTNSTYLTRDPDQAHLFFVPFSPDSLSTRSLTRVISRIRTNFPYWNRTLGTDHFYLTCHGIPHVPDRNLVELEKNAIQISCFPTQKDKFIPHKDITLPPVPIPHALSTRVQPSALFNNTETSFCVVEYEKDVSWIGDAMRLGCVPVVVAKGPVNDMPFMDVLRWREIAVFVRSERGVKRVFKEQVRMRELGVRASKHLRWNQPTLPFDAFNTIIYQLWLRRHTIRYTRMQ